MRESRLVLGVFGLGSASKICILVPANPVPALALLARLRRPSRHSRATPSACPDPGGSLLFQRPTALPVHPGPDLPPAPSAIPGCLFGAGTAMIWAALGQAPGPPGYFPAESQRERRGGARGCPVLLSKDSSCHHGAKSVSSQLLHPSNYNGVCQQQTERVPQASGGPAPR